MKFSQNIFSVCFFLGLVFTPLFAQETGTIYGTVISKKDSASLAGANIEILNTRYGAASDNNGHYIILNIPAGVYSVQVQMQGYQKEVLDSIKVDSGTIKRCDVELFPTVLLFDPISVEADRLSPKYQTEVSLVGVQWITPRNISKIPGAFDDPIRALSLVSSAGEASDYNSFLVVRGSSPHENLVVMDDIVIPNPYRFRMALGGGLSIFDPYTTKDIYLHPGGFTAEYGNNLSSVLEVETKSGNFNKFGCVGSLNLMDAQLLLEGPIIKNKLSSLLSCRRSNFDLLASRLIKGNSTYPYNFSIFNKWTYETDRNSFSLNIFVNKEGTKLDSELSDAVNFSENALLQSINLSWNNYINNIMKIKTVFAFSDESMDYNAYGQTTKNDSTEFQLLESKTRNLTIKSLLKYTHSSNLSVRIGINSTQSIPDIYFRGNNNAFLFARNEFPQKIIFDKHFFYHAAFCEYVGKITQNFQVRLGFRFDHSTLIKDSHASPRVNLWARLSPRTTLEGSWGISYQYPDPSSIFTRDQPLNFGPRIDYLTAEKATHNVLGIRHILNNYSIKIDFFHRELNRLLLPEDQELYLPNNDGIGYSRGVEFFIEKRPDLDKKLSGLFSYFYVKNQYRPLYVDSWIPFNFDRRHSLSVLANYQLGKMLTFSLQWRITSGLPYTDVPGVYLYSGFEDVENFWSFYQTGKNGKRFSYYQRMDIRLNYQLIDEEIKKLAIYLDIINLYNHYNVYNIIWERIESESEKYFQKRYIYTFPFLPSIGLNFQF